MFVDGWIFISPLPAKFIYPWAVNGLGSSNEDVIAYPSKADTGSFGFLQSLLRGSCFPFLLGFTAGVAWLLLEIN